MSKAETNEGKSYKEQLTATVAAATKLIKQSAEVKKIQGLVSKETTQKVIVQSDNE